MKQIIPILVSGVFLVSGGGAFAASPGAIPMVRISIPQSRITIGDSVAIRCTVTVPPGVIVAEPFPVEENPFLDVERRAVGEEKTAAGIVRNYDFVGYVLSPDSVRIGPFAVRYIAAGDTGQVVSAAFDFRVAGFVKSAEDSLRQRRGPVRVSGGWFPLWLLLLILVLLAVAVFLYRRRRKHPVPLPETEGPPDEIELFERIRSQHLAETGRVKELYAEVSDAMRGFVHRNMGFDALYSTTDEIRRGLRAWKDRETADAVRVIFEESDMVKFARYLPAPEQPASLIDRALVPVRTVIAGIEAERERERLAEEERRRAAVPPPSAASPADASPSAGEEGAK